MKTCQHKDCKNPVFSHNFCQWHQTDRLDKAFLNAKTKKKTKVVSYTKSGEKVSHNSPNEAYKQITPLAQTYFEIWNERPHISFLSGVPIFYEVMTWYWLSLFAHVLAKGKNKYPKYRHYKNNIILLSPYEHWLLDSGTKAQREKYAQENNCDWQKIYNLADELKKQYPDI